MKKLLISLLCVIMVVCFMPTMAFATVTDATGATDGTGATETGATDTGTTEGGESTQPTTPVEPADPADPGVECPNIESCDIHEAAIGERHYATLEEAIAVAKRDDIVKVLKDITHPAKAYTHFDIDKKITLDLNSKAIISPGFGNHPEATHFIRVESGGDLTITDNSTDKNGSITASYDADSSLDVVEVMNGGTFTMMGGKIQNAPGKDTKKGSATVYVQPGGSFELKGGTVAANKAKNKAWAVYVYDGNMTMSGGTIEANGGKSTYTIEKKESAWSIALTGGMISGQYQECLTEPYVGVYGVDNDTYTHILSEAPESYKALKNNNLYYVGDNGAAEAIQSATSGDTITLMESTDAYTTKVFDSGSLTIGLGQGVTFNPERIKVKKGYKLVTEIIDSVTTKYSVVVDEAEAGARIGDTYYPSLSEAYNASKDGDTITLLKEYSISSLSVRNKGLTIDLNGNEIIGTGSSGAIQYWGDTGKTLTITDSSVNGGGKITSKDKKSKFAVSAGTGTVIITGGTVRCLEPGTAALKESETGTLHVTGGSFSSDPTPYVKSACYTVSKDNPDAPTLWTVTLNAHDWSEEGEITLEPTYDATGEKTFTCIVEGCGETKIEVIPKKERPYVPTAPSAPADNVTNQPGTQGTGTTEATAPTTTADMSSTTAVKTETKVDAATGETKNVVTSETTVDNTTAEKIVDKAVENKSEEVIIDTTTSTPATTEAAQVGIPTATLEAISEKTEADVTVKTDVAEVTMDNKTAGEIAEQATGVTVHIVAEKTKEEATKVEFELKVVDSNGTVISDFNGGNVSVTVKVPTVMKDKKLVCVYIDDNGKYSKVSGAKNNDGTYTFITGHFSAYAIMTEEEADAAIAAQVDELLKGFDDIDLVARSVRTSKGNVKVTLKVDKEGQALIKELKEAGCTVKYNFYRSTKKRSDYVSKMIKETKTYTNTYGKKGTVYYYKARVQVYDAEGKLIAKTALKDCKYASRLWKK